MIATTTISMWHVATGYTKLGENEKVSVVPGLAWGAEVLFIFWIGGWSQKVYWKALRKARNTSTFSQLPSLKVVKRLFYAVPVFLGLQWRRKGPASQILGSQSWFIRQTRRPFAKCCRKVNRIYLKVLVKTNHKFNPQPLRYSFLIELKMKKIKNTSLEAVFTKKSFNVYEVGVKACVVLERSSFLLCNAGCISPFHSHV